MRFHGLSLLVLLTLPFASSTVAQERPNILWITCEDTGPQLGAYGDKYAVTPHLDRLASQGMLYRYAWSNAPVCAPARTTIISGLYPPSTGSENMRSMTRLPAGMKMYPQFLREAGYYCTNNSKEDYNLEKPGQVWDDSSNKAHWKNRKPGQPFFAIFNHTITHESQIRVRPHTLVHDPAKARVPAYHPDTPEVRHDWAQYYDNITAMDTLAGKNLQELREAGLADNTIVFFYGDHGSGMPRSKRWPYNSGLQVPLIVYIPEKFKELAPREYAAGGQSERLVSFVDLAPTLLSLAGIRPPDTLQGYAFMGKYESPEQPYVYGFRGRMDERYDLVRSVRDRRYVYIRNYMPHKIYGQHIDYMFQTPTTQIWKKLHDEGKLTPQQDIFWNTKPPEELYDLQNDRDEVNNLAYLPGYRDVLERMRKAQQNLALRIRDVGFLPEGEIHSRSKDSTPYEIGHNDGKYPLRRIMDMAELASSTKWEPLPALRKALMDPDSAVRYWAANYILMRGQAAVEATQGELSKALTDDSPFVRVVAAQALGQFGNDADLRAALPVLTQLAPLGRNSVYVSLSALNALDNLGGKTASVLETIKGLPVSDASVVQRMDSYVPRLIEKIVRNIEKK